MYGMYKWNRAGSATEDGPTASTATRPKGGSSNNAGTARTAVTTAAHNGAANGHGPHAGRRGRGLHPPGAPWDATNPAPGGPDGARRARPASPGHPAGGTPAERAVQAALDRRDNGGDACGLRGQ